MRRLEDGEALGGRIKPIQLDITDPEQVEALPDALGGSLDALVNNAGIVVSGPVEAITAANLREQLQVNVVAQVAVTQAVLPLLRASKGRVVFIGSVSGRVATPFTGAYNASKFAIEGLADALRMELKPWGIRVAIVEPGSIDTDLWRTALETADKDEAEMAPHHRELYAARSRACARAWPGSETHVASGEGRRRGRKGAHSVEAARPLPGRSGRAWPGGDAERAAAAGGRRPDHALHQPQPLTDATKPRTSAAGSE